MRPRGRHRRRRIRLLGPALAAAVGLLASGSGATASTAPTSSGVIVYQCPDGQHICAVSPSGGTPTQLAQTGTLAGLTRDGNTYGYAGPSTSIAGHEGLFEAPVAGGSPTEVNANALGADLDPPRPVMSADGSVFLENREQAGYFNQPDTDDIDEFSVSAGDSSMPTVVDSSTRLGMTYGWLGDSTLVTHAAGVGLQPPSWACIGYTPGADQDFCSNTDPHAKIQSSSSTINFPAGSPDSSQVVAIVGAPGQAGGSIALFNAQTGAMTATVASPPAGVLYAAPQFSPDGSQIVFEADPTSGGTPSIEVVGVSGGQPTTIAQGGSPFWGAGSGTGTGSSSGSANQPAASRVSLAVPHQTLGSLRRNRRLLSGCTLAGPGTCTIRVTVSASAARRLKLKVSSPGAGTVTLASGSRTLRRRGSVLVGLSLSSATLRALAYTRRLTLTLTATSSRTGHRPVSASRTITLS